MIVPFATPPAIVAQASPAPTPTPASFIISGYLRAYDFTRQNASNNLGEQYSPAKYNDNAVNQQSFEAAVSMHVAYNVDGFSVGGTYLFADPLGPCDLVINDIKGSPCITRIPPNTNPDNTVPDYQLATLYEAYAAYSAHGLFGKIGNQLITTPWANPTDTRIKPAAFQGADLGYALGSWTLEGMDMISFQSRDSSFFVRDTLLTSYPPTGNNGLPGNNTPPANVKFASNDPFGYIPTDGFWLGRVVYNGHGGLTGEADYYTTGDIANIAWLTAKYTAPTYLKPFVGIQLGDENSTGQAVIGKINSQIYGVQAGVNLLPSMQLIVGYDDLPWKSDTITLSSGVKCSSTTHLLSIPTPSDAHYTFPYFIANNAPECMPGAVAGTATIFYGGWASPYTDGTTQDPVYTTQMTQGAIDRHVAGPSLKFALIFTSADRHFVGLVSHSNFNAGNAGGPQSSDETDLDGMYYMNEYVIGRRYRGLLLRYRYGERYFSNTQIYGGLPLFKYNRAQLEYDF